MNKQNIENIFELSPMQQGMLFHTLYSANLDPYVYQYTARIKGGLRVAPFKKAWQTAMDRHQVLRTSFYWQEIDKPLQVVYKRLELSFFQEDWRSLTAIEQQEHLEAYLQDDRERGFDFSTPPLLRLSLIRLDDKTYQFVWSFHHILLDGWSVNLLLKEVFAYYEAFRQQEELELPWPRPYSDYIAWLQQDLTKAEQFWRRTLKGFTSPTSLPFDRGPDKARGEDIHDAEYINLSADITAALRSLTRQHQLTLNTLMQGVWGILLSHYTRQTDIVFGSVVSGRPHDLDGAESMIGLFINTLPTRVKVEPEATFVSWLKKLQVEQFEARQYEYSPLVHVQRWSEVPRTKSLFEHLMVFENFPVNDSAASLIEDLQLEMSRSFEQNSYPLAFVVMPYAEIQLVVSYSRAHFDKTAMVQILADLQSLLSSIVAHPEQTISELPQGSHDLLTPGSAAAAEKIADLYPGSNLTQDQLVMWVGQQLQPRAAVYNMTHAFSVSGDISAKHFQKAFQTLLNSSDALRTVVDETDGVPFQRVVESFPYEVEWIDFSQFNEPARVAWAWMRKRCQRPFGFEKRLFDTALLKISEGHFVWYLNIHHIVADAWSHSLIFRYTSELYEQALASRLDQRLELPSFRDFVRREQEERHSPQYKEAESYWQQKLSVACEPIRFYNSAQLTRSTRVERSSLDLGRERTRRLEELALKEGIFIKSRNVTLFNIFASVLFTYLYRLSGNQRLSLGTPFHNRDTEVLRKTIGMIMRTQPLRINVEAGDTLRTLVQKVSADASEALRHQQYVVENPSHNRVFDVILNFHNATYPKFHGATVTTEWLHSGHENISFALVVHDFNLTGTLNLYFDLHCDVFDKTQRPLVIQHFTHVLDAMLEDEGRAVSTIMLPAEMTGPQPRAIYDVSEQSNLTQSQLSFWMAQQFQPHLPLFNLASLLIISRAIDHKLFDKAFQTLVNSSDALRTIIEDVDGLPQQRVVSRLPLELDYLEFSHLPDPQIALRAWAEERSRVCFKLNERMFDSALVKLSEEKYGWFINHHQIISDAWSSGVIVRRMSEIYERALAGRLPEVVELPSFQRYIAREAENRHTSHYLKGQAYWKQKRESKLDPIEFYGEPASPVTTRVLRVPCPIGIERSQRLKAIAELKEVSRGFDTTIFCIFTSLLFVYMYRVSGNRALALATPLSNRDSPAFKETIGMFMEVVPLQVEIASGETFLSLIKKVSIKFFEVAKHRGYPIRNSSKDKVYDVCLNYVHAAVSAFAGAQVESSWIHPGAGNEALTLQVHDFNKTGNFIVDFDFDCEVFDKECRERVIDHFLKVLDSFLEDYTRSVHSFSLLMAREQQVLLKDFNKSEMIVPHDQTFPKLFEAQVRLTPNQVAVTYQDESLTYTQLNARANRLARYLRASGVGPEDVVALLARRTPDFLTAILAVMKAGAAYLPLNPFEPSKRHTQLLLQSGSIMALAASEFQFALSRAVESIQPAQHPPIRCLEESLHSNFNEENLPALSDARNLAYIIYTSGSTGEPKGAMLEQAGMVNHIFAKIKDLDLSNSDVIAQTASQCFDISVWQFLTALILGGRVHIVRDELTRDPVGLLNEVNRAGVSVLETVPSLLRGMTDELYIITREELSLSKMRWMLVTGEALEPELCRNWFEIYPSVPLLNAYGPTECSDDVAHYVVDAAAVEEQRRVPIGRPVGNMRLYVLDEKLYPVPRGVAGELYVGGSGVGRGYLNDPAQTAENFIADPFGTDGGARLYRTGDLARHRRDENLEFLGRVDHQVKVRGHRIELQEIEVVLRKHAAVCQNLIVAREDTPGEKQLVAYVVLEQGEPVSATELRGFLTESLPEYMIPAAFVILEALPLNANGKVNRKALPAPERIDLASEEQYLAPRNVLEFQLAQIWQAILGVEQVGVRDNFFDLGGHSLLAVRLIAQIRKRLGQELPLATLIETATIERLATILSEQDMKRYRSPLVSIQPKGVHTPFFCVHPGSGNVLCYLPIAQHLGTEWPFYGLQDPSTLEDPEQQSTSDFELPLELMAANYIDAIRTIQPQGPYLLGGWSFGGFVAYEMAQQLRNCGEEVRLLAILDTGPVVGSMGDADDARLLAILCEESGLAIKAEDLRSLSLNDQLNYVAERLKSARLVPSDIPVSRISRSVNIFRARIKVASSYELKPYDGPITLFRASEPESGDERDTSYFNEPTMGWSNFTRHSVEVHTVPGTHATMGREPNVQVLASALKECLEKAIFELANDRP